MRLPINLEELLGGRAVEGDRIEYKTGWNPDAIYRSICAFANDFDETGGGYIIVGVKEENGRAIRPVIGIESDKIEPIEKEMVGYNNLMRPYYQPRLYVEEVDGKTILVIRVLPGERRPYKVPDNITAKVASETGTPPASGMDRGASIQVIAAHIAHSTRFLVLEREL